MSEKNQKQVNKVIENNANESDSVDNDGAQDREKAKKMVKINVFFNKYFKFFILLLVLIIFSTSYLHILKPKYDKAVKAVKGNIVNQERVYLQQLNKLNNFKKLVSVYNKIPADEREKLNNLLPPDYVKEQLFIELGYIIPRNGHNLTHLNFKKDTEIEAKQTEKRNLNTTEEEKKANSFLDDLPEDIGYIDAKLELSSASYNGIRNLLKLLENNLRLIDVYEINFEPKEETLELNFVTYYLKEKE